MKTQKRTHYEVRTSNLNGGSYSQSGFSEYYKRLSMADKKEIKYSEVYGVEQAIAHISELRSHVYEGKKHLLHVPFYIVKVVTTEMTIREFLPVVA